jgi:peptidyl-prolyl cis-trans isomerase C
MKQKVMTWLGAVILAHIALGLTACGEQVTDISEKALDSGPMRLGDVEVAKVDGTVIYQSDVERLALERSLIKPGEPFSQTDPSFMTLLEELVDQRLLALRAVRQSLDQTDENKHRLAAARERILGNILVEEHLKERVNETTIRRMYDEQAALVDRGDEIRARHILLSDEASAKAALKSIQEGEDFGELARSISLDEGSRETGGNLGYFTRDMLSPDFTKVIFSTPKGERTAVFQTEFGWHIAEVLDRRPAQKQSFETLRPNIVKFMTFDSIQSLVQDLRKAGEVEILVDASTASDNSEENLDQVESETETTEEEN